jgi:hypothetical protein
MHISCPHCKKPIELADLPSGGVITCAGCGSSFQIDKLATASWDAAASKVIGKFEVLGTVGHGAFGTVLTFLAKHASSRVASVGATKVLEQMTATTDPVALLTRNIQADGVPMVHRTLGETEPAARPCRPNRPRQSHRTGNGHQYR